MGSGASVGLRVVARCFSVNRLEKTDGGDVDAKVLLDRGGNVTRNACTAADSVSDETET